MNFFSSDGFLEVVGDVFFANERRSIAPVRVDDLVYRLLIVNGKAVPRWPFLDFFEPLSALPQAPLRTAPYLPRVCHGVVTAEAFRVENMKAAYEPSPFVDWQVVGSFEDYRAQVRARSPFPFNVSARKARKLAREVGPLRIEARHDDTALVRRCMEWKSRQYLQSGYKDLFATEANRALFLEMCRRGLLHTAGLFAGEKLVAVHTGPVYHGRFYYWLPAHDPELNQYSPGTILFEHLVELAHRERWELDLLLGNEDYKWHFATHTRLIGPAGLEALPLRLWKSFRSLAATTLREQPRVYGLLRGMKRRIESAGL